MFKKRPELIRYFFLSTLSVFFLIHLSFRVNNDELLIRIKEKLNTFNTYYPQEKIYLHFDKPYYSLGENIWFKSYVVDGSSHEPKALSKVIYVELISPDNELIIKKTIGTDIDGGRGDFFLKHTLSSGVYTVRAYTNFMRNFDNSYFFNKKVRVWNANDDSQSNQVLDKPNATITKKSAEQPQSKSLSIQFFPEGGNMISGLLNYVGFKAIDSDGMGVDLDGHIENNKGDTVLEFSTSHFGMGVFVILPKLDDTYTAKVNHNNQLLEFSLPNAIDKGIAMHVDDKGHEYHIRLLSNMKNGIDDVLIIGQQRSQMFCNVNVKRKKSNAIIVVNKSLINDGIAQFTLFDKNGEPLSERLIFVNQQRKTTPKFKITNLKKEYNKREKVEFQIDLVDSLGQKIESDLSIAITDSDVLQRSQYDNDIISHLLLCSDIKGEIENPGYYFDSKNIRRQQDIDILMITQGWRRFIWREILNDSIPPLTHLMENGLSVVGTVSDYFNHSKTARAKVSLSSLSKDFVNDEVETDENGKFVFTGYNFQDSTELILQAKSLKRKKKNTKNGNFDITIEKNQSPPIAPTISINSVHESFTYSKKYLERSREIFKIDSAYKFDKNVIILDGVEVRAKKDPTKDPFYRIEANYAKPDSRIVMDSLPGAKSKLYVFGILQGNVPGVTVSGSFPNHKVMIRGSNTINGSNEPLFILNGMPTDFASIYNISPSEIHFIDVLKGASAAAYGIRGAAGVIAIYTKNGSSQSKVREPKGIVTITHPGYYRSREFYHPSYDVEIKEHLKPDYRTTLYWNPNIKIEKSKESILHFYTSDKSSKYRVEIEGITSSGIPVKFESSFEIK